MDTFQINRILKKKLSHVFKGVHALDQLTCLKTHTPAAYVFNTKPIAVPGEHWVAVYMLKNRKAVYFEKKTLNEMDFLKKRDSKPFHNRLWPALHCVFVALSSF